MSIDSKGIITTDGNYYSLINKTLPEEHVRWILNRLLEFSAYMENLGYVHCGINPESLLVNPVNHGINIISFYHTIKTSSKVGTISAKYKNWYPASLFKNKVATSSIDIALSKGIACTLLGDPSGVGVKLKKVISSPLSNFLIQSHNSAYETMIEYKNLLKNNYESKFYELKL